MENNATVMGTGSSPVVPAVVPIKKSRVVVVTAGGCGANALKAALEKNDPEANTFLSFLAVESNSSVLESCFVVSEDDNQNSGYRSKWVALPERLRKIQLGDAGLGAGGDVEKGRIMAVAKMEELVEYLKDFDNAVLIGGAGGGTCGAMPVIAEALKDLGKPTYAILTMPRMMEGPKKATKARKIRDLMLGLCPTTLIENEHIPDKTLSYSAVWKEINERSLFWILWLLKALLQDKGDVIDLDGSDWKTATSVGKYTVPGFFDASKGLEKLEEGLLGNPYLNAKILEKALAVDFWFEGNWSVEEADRVVELVRKKIKQGDKDDELELKWGIRELGVPAGTKTVGFVAFAEEGPESPDEEKRVKVNIPLETGTAAGHVNGEALQVGASTEAKTVTNGAVNPKPDDGKVDFEGVIGGKKVKSRATPDVIIDYNALFVPKNPPLGHYERALQVREKLKQQTELMFDVPLKPTSNPKWP